MDIQWLDKGKSKVQQGAPTAIITPNTIEGLVGTDLVLSVNQENLYVNKVSTTLATLVIKKIVTWDVKSSTINIINGDPTTLTLVFINNSERNIALTTLENAMNL